MNWNPFKKNKNKDCNLIYYKAIRDSIIAFPVSEEDSINDIIESLCYPINLIETVFTFNSNKIEYICFKVCSKEVLFFKSRDSKVKISKADLNDAIHNINWDIIYSPQNIEAIFEDAILAKNFSLEFLKSVITDLIENDNNCYISPDHELMFIFESNILSSFQSISLSNSSAKWMKRANIYVYNKMLRTALKYHDNFTDAMTEVNINCDSYLSIPNGIENEYLALHIGNDQYNFYNLLVTHYNNSCLKDDFTFMNKGRYVSLKNNCFEVKSYIYKFNNQSLLEEAIAI